MCDQFTLSRPAFLLVCFSACLRFDRLVLDIQSRRGVQVQSASASVSVSGATGVLTVSQTRIARATGRATTQRPSSRMQRPGKKHTQPDTRGNAASNIRWSLQSGRAGCCLLALGCSVCRVVVVVVWRGRQQGWMARSRGGTNCVEEAPGFACGCRGKAKEAPWPLSPLESSPLGLGLPWVPAGPIAHGRTGMNMSTMRLRGRASSRHCPEAMLPLALPQHELAAARRLPGHFIGIVGRQL